MNEKDKLKNYNTLGLYKHESKEINEAKKQKEQKLNEKKSKTENNKKSVRGWKGRGPVMQCHLLAMVLAVIPQQIIIIDNNNVGMLRALHLQHCPHSH